MHFTKTRKKIVSCLTLWIVAIMVIMLVPETITSAKAEEKVIEIKNPITVLTIGDTCSLKAIVSPFDKHEKITWKTSNPSIATIDQKGKVTAKKAGNVVIAAYTESGKRAACVISIVTKAGQTDSVYVLNKMLQSPLCKKITLRQTEKKMKYTIKDGDYSDRTLTVNLPSSHLVNYGLFKKITIDAIGKDTFYEGAIGNSIYVKDRDTNIEVKKNAEVKLLKVVKPKTSIELDISGTVQKLEIAGKDSAVHVYGTGHLDWLSVAKGAKNCAITLECQTTVSMSSDGKIIVNPGAEGTIIEAVKGIERIKIENLSEAPVILRNKRTGIETSIPGVESGTKVLIGQISNHGKEVTYKLPVKLEKIKKLEIQARNLPSYTFGTNALTFIQNMLEAEEQYMLVWYKLSKMELVQGGIPIKISGEANSWRKTVTIASIAFEVSIDQTEKTVKVKRSTGGNEYIFSKVTDTQFKISSPTNTNVGDLLTMRVKY